MTQTRMPQTNIPERRPDTHCAGRWPGIGSSWLILEVDRRAGRNDASDVEIDEADIPARAAERQRQPVRCERDAVELPDLRREGPQFRARRRVPDANRAVVRGGRDRRATGREVDGLDLVGVPAELRGLARL